MLTAWETLKNEIIKRGLKNTDICPALRISTKTMCLYRKQKDIPADKLELFKRFLFDRDFIQPNKIQLNPMHPDWTALLKTIKIKGIKIGDIAVKLGVSRRTVYLWFQAHNPPDHRLHQIRTLVETGRVVEVEYGVDFTNRDLSLLSELSYKNNTHTVVLPESLVNLYKFNRIIELVSLDEGILIKPIKKDYVEWKRTLSKAIKTGTLTPEDLIEFANSLI